MALKKFFKALMYFLGVVIPNISFSLIFITFMIAILSRYIFRQPVAWTYEISVLGFMWTMFFGVGKAIELDEHVVFGLVYDTLKPLGRLLSKLVYNTILILLLAILFVPALRSALKSTMMTGVLKMPYTIIFAPFFFMLADIIIRSGINIKKAVQESRIERKTR